MTGLDEPNFDLFTSFKIDFLDNGRITAATPIQIYWLFFVAQMKLTLAI